MCEPTRLGEGKFVALKQQHRYFLAQFRFRHTHRLQQRIWYRETHTNSPLNGMVRKTFFLEHLTTFYTKSARSMGVCHAERREASHHVQGWRPFAQPSPHLLPHEERREERGLVPLSTAHAHAWMTTLPPSCTCMCRSWP